MKVKNLITGALILGLIAPTVMGALEVSAAPAQDEINTIQKSMKDSGNNIKTLVSNHDKSKEAQMKINNDMSVIKIELDKLEGTLAKDKENYAKVTKKAEELKAKADEQQAELEDYVRKIQMVDEDVNAMKIVADSENLSDLIKRILAYNDTSKDKAEKSEKLLAMKEKLDKTLQELAESQEVLTTQTVKTETKKVEFETKTATLEKQKKEDKASIEKVKDESAFLSLSLEQEIERTLILQEKALQSKNTKEYDRLTKLLAEYNKQLSELDGYTGDIKVDISKEVGKYRKDMEALAEKEAKEEAEKNKGKNIGGLGLASKDATGDIKKLLEAAETKLGLPYVWGGNNPETGLDCSSFTQWAYAQIGVSLQRVTYQQDKQGWEVAPKDIQPGDLIFWGEPSTHVAIYVGDGIYIHAPEPGDVIKYSKWNVEGVSSIRRYVK